MFDWQRVFRLEKAVIYVASVRLFIYLVFTLPVVYADNLQSLPSNKTLTPQLQLQTVEDTSAKTSVVSSSQQTMRATSTKTLIAQLQQQAVVAKLAEHYVWRGLLHMKGKTSIIKDKNFFLDPQGHRDAQAELLTDIAAFFADGSAGDVHAICRFPGRLAFVMEQLHIDKNILPQVQCQDLSQYMAKLAPEKITVIFAAESVTSPASMMGHLFLKISGHRDGQEVEHAFSYFADFSKQTGFKFYLDALFSSTAGVYILSPYVAKREEYQFKSGRNIWEYELNLTPAQVKQFVSHLWELKGVDVPYNFIFHNCGTASLRLLAPIDKRFYDFYGKAWMSPLDTIQKMRRLGLISSINLFPSIRYRLRSFEPYTTKIQQQSSRQLATMQLDTYYQQAAPELQSQLVELADMILLDQLRRQQITPDGYSQRKQFLLQQQQGLPEAKQPPQLSSPLDNALSSSIQVGFGQYKDNAALYLSLHPVYHSLNDYQANDGDNFQLRLLHADLVQDLDAHKLYLHNFDLIHMQLLTPSSFLVPTWSSGLKLGFQNTLKLAENHLYPVADVSIGKTYKLGEGAVIVAGMLHAGWSEKSYVAPEAIMIWRLGTRSKTILNYRYDWHGSNWQQQQFNIGYNFYFRANHHLEAAYKYVETAEEQHYADFSVSYYYNF